MTVKVVEWRLKWKKKGTYPLCGRRGIRAGKSAQKAGA